MVYIIVKEWFITGWPFVDTFVGEEVLWFTVADKELVVLMDKVCTAVALVDDSANDVEWTWENELEAWRETDQLLLMTSWEVMVNGEEVVTGIDELHNEHVLLVDGNTSIDENDSVVAFVRYV